MYASSGKSKSWKKKKGKKKQTTHVTAPHTYASSEGGGEGGGEDEIKCKIVWEVDFYVFFALTKTILIG